MKNLILLLITFCYPLLLVGQQLPKNPDPNKCYVRIVTPDIYETEKEEFLTYTIKEAALYPHKRKRIVVKPELSQWETTRYEGCESPNPNDCQVLCYKTYPGEYKIVYEPKDESLGKPFYREIVRSFLVEKGGLCSYEEVNCELTSYQPLEPLSFNTEEGFLPEEEEFLEDGILNIFDEHPGIRLQFQFRHAGAEPEVEAEILEAYLIENGVNRNSLVFQYLPSDKLAANELEIHWRVLSVNQ